MAAFFKTADYGVAGYLLARSFSLEETERNGSQVVFCFRDAPELVAAIGDYTSNKLVPCRDLFHGLRRAKTMIQETIRQYEKHTSR